MKNISVAALLLAVAVLHELGFQHAPDELAGYVWSATGGLLDVVLWVLVAVAYRSRTVRVVCLLAGTFAAQTFACNAGWLWLRWAIVPGAASCTDSLWPVLSAATLVVIGGVTQYVASRETDAPN